MLSRFFSGMLYPAPGVAVPSPPPPPLEEVRLALATGEEAVAWLLEPAAPDGLVALFFHGNGENLETLRRVGVFELLSRLGVSALAVDYPGYGRSSGRPTEAGVLGTCPAALEWAAGRWPARPVVVCGWSLGAAVAIHGAAGGGDRVAGLVALSPWTSLRDTVRSHAPEWVAGSLFSERYDSLAAAASVGAPALVIHGEADPVIPVDQGERIAEALAAANGGEVRWVSLPGTGHGDLMARDRVWEELARFFDALR